MKRRKSLDELTIYKLKLLKVIEEAKDTYTYFFDMPKDVDWIGGQHSHFVLPEHELDEKSVRHLSFITLPHEEAIGITTRLRGEFSYFKKYLKNLKIGEELHMTGIVGRFSLIRRDIPIVLLSSGVGIATMRPLIKEFQRDNNRIEAMQSINIDSSKDYIYEEELIELNDHIKNFYHKYVDNREEFYSSIDHIVDDYKNDAYYYIVGSDSFASAVEGYLNEKGIDKVLLDRRNNGHPDYEQNK